MQVTKEWVNYRPFEEALRELWESGEAEWRTSFTRGRIRDLINSGRFGENFIATNSPKSGSVEDILSRHTAAGEVWFDVQNLCYHYSWQNPNGNFRSKIQMLNWLGGRGDSAKYCLRAQVFE